MFDYHMHSNFSADCSVKMEDMVNGAISKGLTEICFTEHIDYEYPDKNFIFEFNLDEYDKKVKQLQHKYQDQIKIRKEVEISVQNNILNRYKTLMDHETFIFVICSLHTTVK